MTLRQRRCLLCIQDHFARCGRAPTYREIATALSIASVSNIFRVVHALIDQGYLALERGDLRVTHPIEPIIELFVFNEETKTLQRHAASQTTRGAA